MEEQTLAFKTFHKFSPTEQRSNTGCQAEPEGYKQAMYFPHVSKAVQHTGKWLSVQGPRTS